MMKKIIFYLPLIAFAIGLSSCTNKAELREKQAQRLKRDAKEAIVQHGRYGKQMAFNYINEAISLSPKSPSLYATKSDFCSDFELLDSAIYFINKAIELDPENPDFRSSKGFLLQSNLDSTKAEESFKEAFDIFKKRIDANEDKTGSLVAMYYLQNSLGKSAEECIKELRLAAEQDTALNKDQIESSILVLETYLK